MAGSIPTFDPWFPPRGGNALPFALSPLQERALRAVASLLDELRPPQVLPSETVLPEPPRQRSRLWKRSTVEPPAERTVVTFIDSVEVPWGLRLDAPGRLEVDPP
jgi:hypothetical protein